MIPDSPNWASIDWYLAYPQYSFAKPEPPADKDVPFVISVGPAELANSQGKLNKKYWTLTYEGTDVRIDGQTLFEELVPVVRLALTFDQLGRPIVFYHVQNESKSIDQLKLYWYDPVQGEYTVVVAASGRSPVAGFDMVKDTGLQYSDAMVFYVRDDIAYMRVQRDRFEVEYETILTRPGLELLCAATRADNRFQVQARVKKEGAPVGFKWTPESPVSADWVGETWQVAGVPLISTLYPRKLKAEITNSQVGFSFKSSEIVKKSPFEKTSSDVGFVFVMDSVIVDLESATEITSSAIGFTFEVGSVLKNITPNSEETNNSVSFVFGVSGILQLSAVEVTNSDVAFVIQFE